MNDEVTEDLFCDELEQRLQTKAEAAKWAAERRRRLARGEFKDLIIRPQDQEFYRKGTEQGCNVWFFRALTQDLSCFESVYSSYLALLEAVRRLGSF